MVISLPLILLCQRTQSNLVGRFSAKMFSVWWHSTNNFDFVVIPSAYVYLFKSSFWYAAACIPSRSACMIMECRGKWLIISLPLLSSYTPPPTKPPFLHPYSFPKRSCNWFSEVILRISRFTYFNFCLFMPIIGFRGMCIAKLFSILFHHYCINQSIYF